MSVQATATENGVEETKILDLTTMNPNVLGVQYAVRGPLLVRALEIMKELADGVPKPYSNVIRCNIGDAQAMGQAPLTWVRQIVAVCTCPELLMELNELPSDVKKRGKRLLDACGGKSVGAYTASVGIQVIRNDIAAFIEKRDGYPSKPENVFMSTGASCSIKSMLFSIMTGKSGKERAGVMIPTPQYPLYSATLSEYNAFPINYYLNEEKNWSLEVGELKRALDAARDLCVPRAIVIINPGNPTGQVLTRENIVDVIKFAYEERLIILADEVYQHNIYADGSHFHSFKKVINELGAPYKNMELATFFSVSKGFMGECGFRGGYCEAVNFNPDVITQLYKLLSVRLCPPTSSQIVMDSIVNPPKPGEESFVKYEEEKLHVLNDLKVKARLMTDTLNSMDGITCNEIQGAMYAFPRLHLPQKAIEAATKAGQKPDDFYCFALLEEAGICTVPGSGFGQREGTYHLRTTILPQLKDMDEVLTRFREFQASFMAKYQ